MPTENENLDANEAASSTAHPDATTTTASSAATDANDGKSKDFAELAIEAMNLKSKATESSTEAPDPNAEAAAGDIIKHNTTDEKPLEAASDQAPKPDDKKEDDFSSLPFHKHERFQALVKERNEFKTIAETTKPLVERQTVLEQFMAANRISPDQFKQLMEIQALINVSPEQALERIEPIYQKLQEFKGLVLPDDLKTEVDAGTLPLARAQEIAKLRKQTQFKEQQTQQTARDTNAERLMSALSSWEDVARRTDPDYERKKNFVLNRFVALSAQQPWQTPEQAVTLAKRAYDEVNNELGTFVPKPKPTRNPPPNGHSAAAKPAFTSWDQAEDFAIDTLRRRR